MKSMAVSKAQPAAAASHSALFTAPRFMLAAHITPRVVMCSLVGELLLLVLIYLPAAFGWTTRLRLAEALVMTVAGVISFGLATLLSWEVAREYRQARWARLAWLLLAVSAAISLLKRAVGSPLFDLVQEGYRVGPLRGLLDNLLVVPSNVCLLAGLLAMWWAFHQLGLGFRIKRRDYLAMTIVAGMFLTLLVFREDLSQGRSPYFLGRMLQPIGLLLLGVVSAFGLVLHRYAVQMGDGRLAAVMRWLMIYVLLRGVLVFWRSSLNPALPLMLDSPSDFNQWMLDALWQIVPWAAAMAAACRAQLTVSAAAQLEQWRAAKAETTTVSV